MVYQVGQIMLYVNNQDESVKFWTEKVGFSIRSEQDNGQGMRWIEIAPTKEAETSIVLHSKELIARMQPELNLGTPSMMFFSENLDQLYKDFKDMPGGVKVFNFADQENNYFAVMEKRK
jgi:lactoylglutathione lyase